MSKLAPIAYESLIWLSVKTRWRNNWLDNDLWSTFVEKIWKTEYRRNPTRLAIHENFDDMHFFDDGIVSQRWEITYPRLLIELDREINSILSFRSEDISNLEEYKNFKKLPKDEQLKVYLRFYYAQFKPKWDMILWWSDDNSSDTPATRTYRPGPNIATIL